MGDLHRQALARDLARRILALAERDPNAVRVIDRIATRLELGHERYGALDLADGRDWRRERSDELIDAVVYDTIEAIRGEDAAHASLQAAAADELTEISRRRRVDDACEAQRESRSIAVRRQERDDEAAELSRWKANDQRTTASPLTQTIAGTADAVPEPVVEWEDGEGPRGRNGR